MSFQSDRAEKKTDLSIVDSQWTLLDARKSKYFDSKKIPHMKLMT